MRSLLTRAAAVLALAFGATFATQGIALADSHDHPVDVTSHGHVVDQDTTGEDGILSGNNIFIPVNLALVLTDINVLSLVDEN